MRIAAFETYSVSMGRIAAGDFPERSSSCRICSEMDKLDLHDVCSLIHYESETVEAITKNLSRIKSLHNYASSIEQVEGGRIPDFKSRYFTADFPYGLSIIEELVTVLGFDAPIIKDTMDWYRKVTGEIIALT